MEAAKRNGGDENVADTLSPLPEHRYRKPFDVSKALEDMGWEDEQSESTAGVTV